jgi:predicted DNA-binding transcriptional regulator AlpA
MNRRGLPEPMSRRTVKVREIGVDEFLSVGEVARVRICSVRSVKRYVDEQLTGKRIDDFPLPITDAGHMKWLKSEVLAWVERKKAVRDAQQARIKEILRFERKSA